tara:strand:- start:1033 stop:1518 length:486 start_codon:yes stop_codon:yes gene_type:complete
VAIGLIADPASSTPVENPSQDQIKIEHAAFVLSSNDGSGWLNGYLVIWNGSTHGVALTGIKSSTAGKAKIMQAALMASGQDAEAKDFVAIPPRSELLMKPGGVFVRFDLSGAEIRPGTDLALTLEFAGAFSKQVTSVIQAGGSELTDHHHGMKQTRIRDEK